jgi:hypothetical protein
MMWQIFLVEFNLLISIFYEFLFGSFVISYFLVSLMASCVQLLGSLSNFSVVEKNNKCYEHVSHIVSYLNGNTH